MGWSHLCNTCQFYLFLRNFVFSSNSRVRYIKVEGSLNSNSVAMRRVERVLLIQWRTGGQVGHRTPATPENQELLVLV
jgi:hypothetical protein